MDGENQDGKHASKEVTVVVNRKIKPGCEKDYDDWQRHFLMSGSKVPGYPGTTTIMDGSTNSAAVRHIIHRFRDKASLDVWENSEELCKLIEEVDNYSTPYLQKATGLETWFTLPDSKAIVAPPKWKMSIVTFVGAYCISSVASYVLSFFLGQEPLLINLFMNIIVVVGLTYFAMPLLSRLLRRWLYSRDLTFATKGKVSGLWELYKEIVIKRGMSIEGVAKVVDIDLNRLPEMEMILEQTTRAVARKQVDLEYLEKRICYLEEEEKRKKRIVTLPPSYYYVENSAPNALPYYSTTGQPPSLPYPPSGYPNLTNDYRDALKNSKEKEEIYERYEGDIAD